jgi:hypothetical protein
VNAAAQMNRLSNRSEQLVVHGVQGTRNNQSMFEEIGALERSARLYQIIGNAELLEGYTRNHARLSATIGELLTLPLDARSQTDARGLLAEADRLSGQLKAAPPNSPRMAEIINAFPHMSEMASTLSNRINKDINDELTSLQLAAQLAQQKLFWWTLLLVPVTVTAVGVFTYLFGRPIRAIDRAISELGRQLYERIRIFADHFVGIGSGLGGALKSYNDAVGSLESRVLVAARKFKELGSASDKEIEIATEIDRAPRSLQIPEQPTLFPAAPPAPEKEGI